MVDYLKKIAISSLIDRAHRMLFRRLELHSQPFPFVLTNNIVKQVQGEMAIKDAYSEVCRASLPEYKSGFLQNVDDAVLYHDSVSSFQEYCSQRGEDGRSICGYKPTGESLGRAYRVFLDNGANCPAGTLPAKPDIGFGLSLAGSEISSASKYKALKILKHDFYSGTAHPLFRRFADYFPEDVIVFNESGLIIPRIVGLDDIVSSLENLAFQVRNVKKGREQREWMVTEGYFGAFFTMPDMDACDEYPKSDLEPVEVEYVYIEHDGDIVDREKKVHGAKVERWRFNVKQFVVKKAEILVEIFAKDNKALAERIESDLKLISDLVYTEARVDVAKAKTLWAVGQYIMGLSFGMLIDVRAIMYNADQNRDQLYVYQIQYAKGVSYSEAESLYLKKNPNNSAGWGRMRFPTYRQKYFRSIMKIIRLPKRDYDQEIEDTIDFMMQMHEGPKII